MSTPFNAKEWSQKILDEAMAALNTDEAKVSFACRIRAESQWFQGSESQAEAMMHRRNLFRKAADTIEALRAQLAACEVERERLLRLLEHAWNRVEDRKREDGIEHCEICAAIAKALAGKE